MTTKERWLSAMKLQPVDRLPFWPKILGDNYAKIHRDRLPKIGMNLEELNGYFGSDELVRLPDFLRIKRTTTSQTVTEDGNSRTTTFVTPLGETRQVHRFDEASASIHPVEFPISDLRDIHIMTKFFEDAEPEIDPEQLAHVKSITDTRGESASTMSWVGKSALMQFVENFAGVEQAHYLLADHRADVEALFEAIHQVQVKRARLIVEHSPADAFYFIENTSTSLISPTQFRELCGGHLEEYGEIITGAGKIYALHMCGHLKALLPDLAGSTATVFESFTSPTLGDTRFIDGRSECPDTCLVGGTNAMVWTKPAAEIIAYIEQELDALPHHRGIAVTSAGVLPPMCRPDTVREVADWVRSYPVRN